MASRNFNAVFLEYRKVSLYSKVVHCSFDGKYISKLSNLYRYNSMSATKESRLFFHGSREGGSRAFLMFAPL